MARAQAFRRVLVPIDFRELEDDETGVEILTVGDRHIALSLASKDALEAALRSTADDGELRLLHATPAFDTGRLYRGKATSSLLGSAVDEIHREAAENSDRVLQTIGEQLLDGVEHSAVSVPGLPLHVILAEAKRFDADLIVIPTSSRGAVARFFLGSTADRIIREAPCPVLVIPARAVEGD